MYITTFKKIELLNKFFFYLSPSLFNNYNYRFPTINSLAIKFKV